MSDNTPTKEEDSDGSPAARKQHDSNVVEGQEVSERHGGAASSCAARPSFSLSPPSPFPSLSFCLTSSLPPCGRTRLRPCHAELTSTASRGELHAVDLHREEITRDIGAHETTRHCTTRPPQSAEGLSSELRSPAPRHWRHGRRTQRTQAVGAGARTRLRATKKEWAAK